MWVRFLFGCVCKSMRGIVIFFQEGKTICTRLSLFLSNSNYTELQCSILRLRSTKIGGLAKVIGKLFGGGVARGSMSFMCEMRERFAVDMFRFGIFGGISVWGASGECFILIT